ncbi:MAG TPA: squalene/phytoene synthase family protein [Pseudorhodoplanes sp.]|jgi:phytoene synthase|nr:squalene/phytoene synthase family protein [Pseudorhodoplanes sp.]
MADHDTYCEALVREFDRDRFLATLFAAARHRPGLLALYAFDIEIARVPRLVREAMAGEIRLQWWRDVITGTGHSGGSPVATALIETMRSFHLPEGDLLAFVDVHAEALHGERPRADVVDAAARAAEVIFDLAARILNDGSDPYLRGLSHAAGLAQAMAREPDRPARAASADAIRSQLASVKDLMCGAPERLWPAFLTLALIPPLLAGKALPQWRRQWIMWRAARDLPHALG